MSEPSRVVDPVSYTKVVASGMAWTTLAVFVGRLTGFVAQLILGWVLSENDFGTYAIAIGLSVIVLTLRSSGAAKLLIQRGSEYDQLARPLAIVSFAVNMLAMFGLWFVAPLAARYYEAPAIVVLMRIIAISMPLSVPADILRARLSIDLRFRDLAIISTSMLVMTQTLTVLLALSGFGPLSFVMPMVAAAVVESIVLWRFVGWWPVGRRLDWDLLVQLLSATKWIVLCGFASALIVQGNQLVVGKMESRDVTGVFFFGFHLAASVAFVFNAGTHRVLLPTLMRLIKQPQRQGQAYQKAVRVLVTVASPMCLWGALVAAPMMHLLWSGKWDRAVPVVQLLGGVLPVYVLMAIGSSVLQSMGRWRANTTLYFLCGIGTVLAAWVGSRVGGLWEIAMAAASFRFSYTLIHGWLVATTIGLPGASFWRAALPPFIGCAAAAGSIHLVANVWLAPFSPITRAGVMTVAYVLSIGMLYRFVFPHRVAEVALVIGRGRSASPTRGAESGNENGSSAHPTIRSEENQ